MIVKPKKILGQNFLVDKNKILEIINSIPYLDNSIVVEVGPGKGALTNYLLEKAQKVIAIEIDQNMVSILKNRIISKNFQLINNDVLKISWNDFLKKEKKIQFVSNLPYYISTKIIFKVVVEKRFESMSIMLQKELVDRIFAKYNTKTYGRLTVAIGSLFNLDKKINVPASCFKPKPKVDSGFIVLSRKKNINFNIEEYLYFIKCSFFNKRKTFINSLKNSKFNDYERVLDFLKINKLKENIRAEEIEINFFIKIFKYLNKNK